MTSVKILTRVSSSLRPYKDGRLIHENKVALINSFNKMGILDLS
jgi:hypothetical protein